ncbi:MAG: hypothetical protein F6K65_26165 [Moorea sp. SIO3C2]|nr:hypothetical protein [Moorena sp. SIO3C2]
MAYGLRYANVHRVQPSNLDYTESPWQNNLQLYNLQLYNLQPSNFQPSNL